MSVPLQPAPPSQISSALTLLYAGHVVQATDAMHKAFHSSISPSTSSPSHSEHAFVAELRQNPFHLLRAIQASKLTLAPAGRGRAARLSNALEVCNFLRSSIYLPQLEQATGRLSSNFQQMLENFQQISRLFAPTFYIQKLRHMPILGRLVLLSL